MILAVAVSPVLCLKVRGYTFCLVNYENLPCLCFDRDIMNPSRDFEDNYQQIFHPNFHENPTLPVPADTFFILLT